jgi:hypothetical protein
MKTITTILATLLLIACEIERPEYAVQQGENQFKPIIPTLPFPYQSYEFRLTIGQDWFDDNLTDPIGYGCKLFAIGKLNYHEGGCNFAISHTNGRCYLSARYYEPITEGTYKLHEGLSKTELFADQPVTCKITFYDSTRFYVDGKLVATVQPLPHKWIASPFIGRSGNDNNYPGGDKPGAFANRKLELNIIRL